MISRPNRVHLHYNDGERIIRYQSVKWRQQPLRVGLLAGRG